LNDIGNDPRPRQVCREDCRSMTMLILSIDKVSAKMVYLTPLEGELETEPGMKFRLTYQGPLRPTGNDSYDAPLDPLAVHKHQIRQCFHKQLKTLWNQSRFLSNYKRDPQDKVDSRPIY
jgi:hypothetical protein